MPSLLTTVRDLERLRQIAAVLAVHGFGEVVDRTGLATLVPGRKRVEGGRMPAGIRLRKVLEDLSLIHISEPTRLDARSRMPSAA